MNAAINLDPLSPALVSLAVTPFLFSHQHDLAIARLHSVQELDPNAPFPHFFLQQAYEGKGDFTHATSRLVLEVSQCGWQSLGS